MVAPTRENGISNVKMLWSNQASHKQKVVVCVESRTGTGCHHKIGVSLCPMRSASMNYIVVIVQRQVQKQRRKERRVLNWKVALQFDIDM